MRYFNAQRIVLDHRVEERGINHALCKDVVAEGDEIHLELEDLECTWMAEDTWVGVGKAGSGYSTYAVYGAALLGRYRSTSQTSGELQAGSLSS